ncbi:GTP pyrophosphokinase [Priestia aryabhattai]|uniref:GTP pyrophosphokinase n=1 Tax=Priestia TaxID=2800373 RepID=UPI000BA0BD34|nr:GTP pyrophosphokinase family protein [Priestia flexa]OZT13982.1 GTP pyrophosphokinase [Priestia aryabhattai]USY53695.1 GTP pyrophosphokinase family protein [Bacillus sp. 1780r2a1]
MKMNHSVDVTQLKTMKQTLTRFMMAYKFALDEMSTKINVLKQEFEYVHDYNPIEHIKTRLKSPESILKKVYRKNGELSLDWIKENLKDIAGIRVTCSFISDIYKLRDMIQSQKDIKIVECKDYIENPKTNGYQSLHLIIEIPVFMSDRQENVFIELQIRSIAMDFWASLEHKIYYKYNKKVPKQLIDELKEAAVTAAELDRKMEKLHEEINYLKLVDGEQEEANELEINHVKFPLPEELLKLVINNKKEG